MTTATTETPAKIAQLFATAAPLGVRLVAGRTIRIHSQRDLREVQRDAVMLATKHVETQTLK